MAFSFRSHFYVDMPTWAHYATNPLSYRPHDYQAFSILLGIVIGIVALAILLAAKVAVSFESGKFAGFSLWALKTLRMVTKLLGTVLLMPFLEVLLAALQCFGPDHTLVDFPDVQCFQGGYASATIVVIVMLCVFVPFTIIMSAIYVEPSPKRVSPLARAPIGRLDTIYVLCRMILTAVFVFSSDPRVQLGFLIPVNVALCFLIVHHQPFYRSVFNQIRAACYFASAFTSFVALLAYLADPGGIGFPVAAAASGPVGAVAGVFTCRMAYQMTVNRVYRRMKLKYDVTGDGLRAGSSLKAGSSQKPVNILRSKSMGDAGKVEAGYGNDEDIYRHMSTIAKTRNRPKTIRVFASVVEVELACRFLHNNRSPEAFFMVEEIFEEGFRQYPKDSMLQLVYADYLETYEFPRGHEPAVCIQKAKSLKPAFDSRFFIFIQDRLLEQSKRTEGLNTSTLNMISEAEQEATNYYQKLISRWPKSKVLLRMYATFLLQIKHDKETAEKFLEVAGQIEDIESRMTTHGFNDRRRSIVPQSISPEPSRHNEILDSPLHVSTDSILRDVNGAQADKPTVLRSLPPSRRGTGIEISALAPPESSTRFVNSRELLYDRDLGERSAVRKEEQSPEDANQKYETEMKGVGWHGRVTEYELDSTGFNDDRQEKIAGPPSESAASTRTSEKEAKQKNYNKSQLLSRLQAPVISLESKQKIIIGIYICIVAATFAIGVISFAIAESTLKDFSRGTRIARIVQLLAQNMRTMAQPGATAADRQNSIRPYFDMALASSQKVTDALHTFYLPYLSQFYQDPANAVIKISNFPSPVKTIEYMNAYEVAKLIHQYADELTSYDWSWYTVDRLQNNHLRFFLDNTLVFGDIYQAAAKRGQDAWVDSSTQKVDILYGLLALMIITLIAWGYFIFRPMIKKTHDEQVRALSMFSLLPGKQLMHMLTDIEEQIETIADEISGSGEGQKGTEGAAASVEAAHMMTRRIDTDHVLKKNSSRKYVTRYIGGLLLLALLAVSLIVGPIVRAIVSVQYAATMNYTNSRRYLCQAVLSLSVEVIWNENTTWMPYESLTWYKDRLHTLKTIHDHAISGVNCIATTTIPELREITLEYAPCTACANRTMGLDGMLEWFISEAETYENAGMALNPRNAYSSLGVMARLMDDIALNINTVDDIFTSIIVNGNNAARTAMIVIFVLTLLSSAGVYIFMLRATVKARQEEMHSAATLVFGIPDTVAQGVPAIKRFIESGGMFVEAK
ncbi:hypothetical protein HK104_005610 [Borealophlyctis nickersoniae]|nr:hypothetical protein HK104_005610 [Borealophlyctis nickersoniae]